MSSRVIKFVAGAGKTTFSIDYMRKNKNGIYLAFNKNVVNSISKSGLLSKTIDSLFQSFLIPKLSSLIPLIGQGKLIKYIETTALPNNLKGVSNINIDSNGNIFNQRKQTQISLNIPNDNLYRMEKFSNSGFIKYIFGKNELRLTDNLRSGLANYLITSYSTQIINLLQSRFSYIIIDEAQDLSGFREKFGKLIFNSNIEVMILGDDNQNINGGGKWFESLKADEENKKSIRCPEGNCSWIRDNIGIEIYGNSDYSKINIIKMDNALKLNNEKNVLLYYSNVGQNKNIIDKWRGEKMTIKKAKGLTIENDIVIIGKTLDSKNLYTAITRTKKNVYSTVSKCKR